MTIVEENKQQVPVKTACEALEVSRATYYRRRQRASRDPQKGPKVSHRRVSDPERQAIFEVLCSEEFADLSPYQVYTKLLQRGTFLCSVRTMYRILQENQTFASAAGNDAIPPIQNPN